MTITNHQREIVAVSQNVIVAFVNSMGRAPDRRERDILLRVVLDYFDHRDAPGSTTALQ